MSSELESLGALQAFMQGCILQPDPAGHADAIRARIAPSPTLHPHERLAIYQRGYVARLLECLEGQFPALRHTLGKSLFADFVAEYLRAYPSRGRTLSELGARFPAYLEQTRPDAARAPSEREAWVDFMIDLARYEWALYLKFDAEGHEGSELATLLTPDAALRLQPSLTLHRYSFPVDAYYQAIAAGMNPDVPGPLDVRLCILRQDFRIRIFRLTMAQYDCLKKMETTRDILSAVHETATEHGASAQEVVMAFRGWRRRWIEQGFFVAVCDSTTSPTDAKGL